MDRMFKVVASLMVNQRSALSGLMHKRMNKLCGTDSAIRFQCVTYLLIFSCKMSTESCLIS